MVVEPAGSPMQNLGFRPRTSLQEPLILSKFPAFLRFAVKPRVSASGTPPILPSRRRLKSTSAPNPNLWRLTSRIVELTRRRQLRQIFEEVEAAKRRHGGTNMIVMNAVMEACVHCRDVDAALRLFEEMSKPGGCGTDTVTYGILLKGLGQAQRVDEAFEMLESLEQSAALGRLQLSPQLIYGLLNALFEAGDIRRANGLVARYRHVLQEDSHSVLLYNLRMKGYINTDFPLGALAVWDEIIRQGLKPDKLTYNTLIFACVKSGRTDAAIQYIAEMKEEAQKANCNELFPDAVTYTILLKGLENNKDMLSVQKVVMDMKSLPGLFIDRTAYTAIVDALLACGSIRGALSVFGEIIKNAGANNNLRPKPHLYLSMMRAFAMRGDFYMVKKLHVKMWSDSTGPVSSQAEREANELLMEAAINDNQSLLQVDIARQILSHIIAKWGAFSWTSRGGMVAMQVEASSGFTSSSFSPFVLPQVLLSDPVEKHMTAFKEANPLPASLDLKNASMHFFSDSVVPVVDDWGSCVGLVHRDDCNDCSELDAPLSTMMRGPPPCVTTSTSIGRVIDLILEKKYEMVVVVRQSDIYESSFISSSRPVGVFTREKMSKLAVPALGLEQPCLCDNSSILESQNL